MPGYHVERSVTIDAPVEKVQSVVEDFGQWSIWSPWLCLEREARVDLFGTPGQSDHGYDWEGKLVGAGKMMMDRISDGTQYMDLEFIKPFKSKAKVRMDLESLDANQTKLTWHMDGKMPFFLFFMVGMMKVYIGMDYERGLKMLKEYIETGTIKSNLEFGGVIDVPEIHYLGVETTCSLDEIGDSMQETIPRAFQLACENGMELAGQPGAIYSKMDFKNRLCTYTAFSQVQSSKSVSGAVTGTIGGCKAIKVIHTGSYQNLGNAWNLAMYQQRHLKIKLLKKQPGFEIYQSDPGEVAEEDIVTEVFVPVRS